MKNFISNGIVGKKGIHGCDFVEVERKSFNSYNELQVRCKRSAKKNT